MDELVRVDFLPGNLQDYNCPTRKNALIEEGLLILEDKVVR